MADLEPIKRFPCTYKDCAASFDTEKQMRSHKKHAPEHDYCHKCNEDFESWEDFNEHKAFRPDKHNLACRVCGEEFKSAKGLKLHIEMFHKVDQKLPCLGCGEKFFRACLLIEHLEFGHCAKITAAEFQGYIVHKHLITEFLKGNNMERFFEKIGRYDAAQDQEEEGGVSLMDEDNYQALSHNTEWGVIKPEIVENNIKDHPNCQGDFPALPSSKSKTSTASEPSSYPMTPDHAASGLSSKLKGLSMNGDNESVCSITSDCTVSTAKPSPWSKGSGKDLFNRSSRASSSIAPSISAYSVENHDRQMAREAGINILNTRFWDPTSSDWNPERFYDTVTQCYYCPFVCEQSFDIPADLNRHIMNGHRITKMRCPRCLDIFPTCTALVAHCESGSRKCTIRKANDFSTFLDRLTGGFLGVEDAVRPDHKKNGSVVVTNPITGKEEVFTPPVANYLKYSVTKPMDWAEKQKTIEIGSRPAENRGLLA